MLLHNSMFELWTIFTFWRDMEFAYSNIVVLMDAFVLYFPWKKKHRRLSTVTTTELKLQVVCFLFCVSFVDVISTWRKHVTYTPALLSKLSSGGQTKTNVSIYQHAPHPFYIFSLIFFPSLPFPCLFVSLKYLVVGLSFQLIIIKRLLLREFCAPNKKKERKQTVDKSRVQNFPSF